MERVIFLDIDGVLNSVAWMSAPDPDPMLPRARIAGDVIGASHYCHVSRAELARDPDRLDPAAINRVAWLARETDSAVVMSTSWRALIDYRGLNTLFAWIADWPPGLARGQTPLLHSLFERGREIEAWLREHPCEGYVILDDLPPEAFPGHEDRLVQTDIGEGLQDEHCDKARRILLRLQG